MNQERNLVSEMLRRFIVGGAAKWEFDDFISNTQSDEELENARLTILNIPNEFPPTSPKHYTSQAGIERILKISEDLAQ